MTSISRIIRSHSNPTNLVTPAHRVYLYPRMKSSSEGPPTADHSLPDRYMVMIEAIERREMYPFINGLAYLDLVQ
jgi:hypothetical protein